MEDKKSFILYADYVHTVSQLPSEDAGNLFKLILEYVNDKDPDETKFGLLVSVAFAQIKQQLKRDLAKWKDNKEKRSLAGKASAESKRQQKQQVLTHVESVEHDSTKSTVTVNATVNEKEGKDVPPELEVDKVFYKPTEKECVEFFETKGYSKEAATHFFQNYNSKDWCDKNGVPIDFWKVKAHGWFKPQDRVKEKKNSAADSSAKLLYALGGDDKNAN